MIRVGIVGLGSFGEAHIQTFQSLPGVEVTAVCSRTPERVRSICDEYGIPRGSTDWNDIASWDDVDAVSVTTADHEHLRPTQIAARSGKHVFVEKPMASTSAEAAEIVQAAADAQVILMPGHILRYAAPYAVLKERIDHGELGEVVSLYARRNRLQRFFTNYARVHAPAFVSLIHDIDIVSWLGGARVRRVRARQRAVLSDQPDALWSTIELENGVLAHIESTWLLPDQGGVGTDDALEVLGTKGKASINIAEGPLVVRSTAGVSYPDVLYEAPAFGTRTGALAAELSDFIRCVERGRAPARIQPEDGVWAVKAVEAAVRSAETEEEIAL